jgi:DNA-3-methyladenine glycosylase
VIYIADDAKGKLSNDEIGISKRIGVEPAGADGLLPYRFYVRGNKFVSARPTK